MRLAFKILFTLLVTLLVLPNLSAQSVRADLLQKLWKAQWITGPGRPINRFTAASDLTLKDYGVFKFRKTIDLSLKPASFMYRAIIACVEKQDISSESRKECA